MEGNCFVFFCILKNNYLHRHKDVKVKQLKNENIHKYRCSKHRDMPRLFMISLEARSPVAQASLELNGYAAQHELDLMTFFRCWDCRPLRPPSLRLF